MSKESLKRAIDRMVEQSIREILPQVINEVLIRTIANSGVLQERTHIQKPQQTQVPGRVKEKPAYPYISDNGGKRIKDVSRPNSLRDLLDEQAGADFYQDPREAMRQSVAEELEYEDEPAPSRAAERLERLNPELRTLAEDMDLEDDGMGEMWGEEHESVVPQMNEIRDPVKAAKSVGLDFSRMAQTIKIAAPVKKRDPDDVRANAQFEEQRLKRKREQLNGGKPID